VAAQADRVEEDKHTQKRKVLIVIKLV
jgi:hypothetical protein